MPQPIMKKYSQGELGEPYAKRPNEALEAFSKKKYKQGELGAAESKAGKKSKGNGLAGADDRSLST